jgi:hypothetical protein
MSRFSDNWLLDKVMFDYIQGGSCACCGFPHLFAPGGLEGLINAMSDLETDSKTHEINAAKVSPWPEDMRDQIWGDRLLLRFKMKREMKYYREFLEEVVKRDNSDASTNNNESTTTKINIQDAIPILHHFCTNQLSPYELHQLFQLQRTDLTEVLKSKYKITSAYAIVFCAVVEQLSNFHHTGYGVDAPPPGCNGGGGVDDDEELFETVLNYNSWGVQGFNLDVATNILLEDSEEEWKVNEETLDIFLKRMVSLAGPTLLARAAKVVTDDDDDDNTNDNSSDDDGTEMDNGQKSETSSNNKPSFRSDRRVARLMIARYWADRLIEKYRSMQEVDNEPST